MVPEPSDPMSNTSATSDPMLNTSDNIGSSSTTTPSPIMPSAGHALTTKLTQENFLLWRTQILPYLTSQGLIGYVNGSMPEPSQTIVTMTNGEAGESRRIIVNPKYTSWYYQDQMVLSIIISSVSEDVLASLVGVTTSFDAWRTLEKNFSASSRARIMQIRMQLTTTKKGDTSVATYYRKMKNLADTLAAVGKPIDDEELISYIMRGLSSEYDSLVTSIMTRGENYTLSDVYAHMLSYEMRLENNSSDFQVSANSVNRGQTSRGGRFSRGRGRGNGGRSPGGRKNQSSQGQTSKESCQICHKMGHGASRCWHRFDQNYQPEETVKMAATASNSYTVDPNWYVDTGATDHITSDLERLTIRERYNGADQIQVVNGSGQSHEDNSSKRRV